MERRGKVGGEVRTRFLVSSKLKLFLYSERRYTCPHPSDLNNQRGRIDCIDFGTLKPYNPSLHLKVTLDAVLQKSTLFFFVWWVAKVNSGDWWLVGLKGLVWVLVYILERIGFFFYRGERIGFFPPENLKNRNKGSNLSLYSFVPKRWARLEHGLPWPDSSHLKCRLWRIF